MGSPSPGGPFALATGINLRDAPGGSVFLFLDLYGGRLCLSLVFDSPPHPASALPPLLPLPSARFCLRRAHPRNRTLTHPCSSQVSSCAAPCSAEPSAQLKLLFRSDSGTACRPAFPLPPPVLTQRRQSNSDTCGAASHTHAHTRLCSSTLAPSLSSNNNTTNLASSVWGEQW